MRFLRSSIARRVSSEKGSFPEVAIRRQPVFHPLPRYVQDLKTNECDGLGLYLNACDNPSCIYAILKSWRNHSHSHCSKLSNGRLSASCAAIARTKEAPPGWGSGSGVFTSFKMDLRLPPLEPFCHTEARLKLLYQRLFA
jgi:hypothetical protein